MRPTIFLVLITCVCVCVCVCAGACYRAVGGDADPTRFHRERERKRESRTDAVLKSLRLESGASEWTHIGEVGRPRTAQDTGSY